MKKISHLKSCQGFSLTEVMVVIGIIGTLSIIAIPSLQTYTAKARQVEAKSSLASAYMAQSSFASEFGSYTACLGDIGYSQEGASYYSVGFHTLDYGYDDCGPTGDRDCNRVSWGETASEDSPPCPLPDSNGQGQVWFAATKSAGSMAPATSANSLDNLPTNVGTNFFIICAAGSISGTAPTTALGYDAWCIRQTQELTHENEEP